MFDHGFIDATNQDDIKHQSEHDNDQRKIKQMFHMDYNFYPYNEPIEQNFYLQVLKLNHEHSLSQRLSQLAFEKCHTVDQQIPFYLSSTCGLFDQMIKKHTDIISSSGHNIEDLRSIAYILHDIESHQLYSHLWHLYMQVGTGQLKLNDIFPEQYQYQSYWPEHIKLLAHTTTNRTIIESEHLACEQITRQRIHYHEEQHRNQEKHLYNITSSIKQTLQQFITEHGLVEVRLKCDYAMALVQNEYRDFQYQSYYQKEHLNENQVKHYIYIYI